VGGEGRLGERADAEDPGIAGREDRGFSKGSPAFVGRSTHGGSDLMAHEVPFQMPALPLLDSAHGFDAELALSAVTDRG
jgi:hypothetical protein